MVEPSKRVVVYADYGQRDDVIVLDRLGKIEDFYQRVGPAYFTVWEGNVRLNDRTYRSIRFRTPPLEESDENAARCELQPHLAERSSHDDIGSADDALRGRLAAERGLEKFKALQSALDTLWQLDSLEQRRRVLESLRNYLERNANYETAVLNEVFWDAAVIDALAGFLFSARGQAREAEAHDALKRVLRQKDSSRSSRWIAFLEKWKGETLRSEWAPGTPERSYQSLERAWAQIEEVSDKPVSQAETFAGLVSHLIADGNMVGGNLVRGLQGARVSDAKLQPLIASDRPVLERADRDRVRKFMQLGGKVSLEGMLAPLRDQANGDPEKLKDIDAIRKGLEAVMVGQDEIRMARYLDPTLQYDRSWLLSRAKEYAAQLIVKLNSDVREMVNAQDRFMDAVYQALLKPIWQQAGAMDGDEILRGIQGLAVEGKDLLLSAFEDLRSGEELDRSQWAVGDDLERLRDEVQGDDDRLFLAVALAEARMGAEKASPAVGKLIEHKRIVDAVLDGPDDSLDRPLLITGGVQPGFYARLRNAEVLYDDRERAFLSVAEAPRAMEDSSTAVTEEGGSGIGRPTDPAQPASSGLRGEEQSVDAEYSRPVSDAEEAGAANEPAEADTVVPNAGAVIENGALTVYPSHRNSLLPYRTAAELDAFCQLGPALSEAYRKAINSGEDQDPILAGLLRAVAFAQFLQGSPAVTENHPDLSAAIPLLLSAVARWGSGPGVPNLNFDFFQPPWRAGRTLEDEEWIRVRKWLAEDSAWGDWPLQATAEDQRQDLNEIFDYLMSVATSSAEVEAFSNEIRQFAEFALMIAKSGGEVVLAKPSSGLHFYHPDDPTLSLLAIQPARCVVAPLHRVPSGGRAALLPPEDLAVDNSPEAQNPYLPILILDDTKPRILGQGAEPEPDWKNSVLPVFRSSKLDLLFRTGRWQTGGPGAFYLPESSLHEVIWLTTAALMDMPNEACGRVDGPPMGFQPDLRKTLNWRGGGYVLGGLREYLRQHGALHVVPMMALINLLRDSSVRDQCVNASNQQLRNLKDFKAAFFGTGRKAHVFQGLARCGEDFALRHPDHPDQSLFSFSKDKLEKDFFGQDGYQFEDFGLEIAHWGMGGPLVRDTLYTKLNRMVF
jgi:hypothetical protein